MGEWKDEHCMMGESSDRMVRGECRMYSERKARAGYATLESHVNFPFRARLSLLQSYSVYRSTIAHSLQRGQLGQ